MPLGDKPHLEAVWLTGVSKKERKEGLLECFLEFLPVSRQTGNAALPAEVAVEFVTDLSVLRWNSRGFPRTVSRCGETTGLSEFWGSRELLSEGLSLYRHPKGAPRID